MPAGYRPKLDKRNDNVTLVFENVTTQSVTVPLINLFANDVTKPVKLISCVQPMFLHDNWMQLVQFLETWNALGVQLFIIYVQSVSPEVSEILEVSIFS